MKETMNKFRVSLLGISLFSSAALFGQKPIDLQNTRSGEAVEYCTTHKKMNALKSDPAYAAQYAADQAAMFQAQQEMLANPSPQRVIYTIPVVFHVLHNGGPENISNEQILDALAILNRDYRLENEDALFVHDDFKASNPSATCTPADIEVEFVLATKAPNGACFSGITRTKNAITSNGEDGGDQVAAIVAGNDVYNGQWPGNKYLNVFICAEIGGAAGYTTNPSSWSANSMQNGIWILHNYLGSMGTSNTNTSRALTHEVGHWLNLDHTWGNTNNPGVSCGSDDVNDTPETRGVTACALNENFCGPRANVENYMDYSYCSKMFSHGQRDRMRAALLVSSTGRANIWSASNLAAVGGDGDTYLCAANFAVNKQDVCAGEIVKFTDASYNNVSGWTWSFPGGTPSSSTEQNPEVVYTAPGTYAVTLTATDGTTSDTETKTTFITVLPEGAELPYYEGFESYSQTSDITHFAVNNISGSPAWTLSSNAGSTGTKSMMLNNFAQTGSSSTDELISAPIDLSDVSSSTGVTLSFRYAYRKKSSSNTETLKVFLSDDCGESWEPRKTITGSSLSSQVVSTSWTPSAADWVTVHMTNVTSSFWIENFRFKFRFEGSGGNNLFLDDINIYKGAPSNEIVLGVEEAQLVNELNVYPNPSEGELNISFTTGVPKTMDFVITDLLGKQIQSTRVQAASGSNLVFMSTQGMASGMYLLRIGADASQQVIQFMVK